MEKNDFVKITYNGKIKESGQNFDKGEDVVMVIGAGHLIKGVDEALVGMKVGEKKTVEIPPEKGFGARNPSLVKLVPISEFRKHNTKPAPGLVINADNRQGRVLSVESGRVKVDFNHPLAGKVLEYEIQINEKIDKPEDKVIGLLGLYVKIEKDKINVKISDKEAEIIVPPVIHPAVKNKLANEIRNFLNLDRVKFSEIFEKPKKK